MCMNLWIMSYLGKGDLDCKTWSNTICWHVCNPCSAWWSELLNQNSKWTPNMKKWWSNKRDLRKRLNNALDENRSHIQLNLLRWKHKDTMRMGSFNQEAANPIKRVKKQVGSSTKGSYHRKMSTRMLTSLKWGRQHAFLGRSSIVGACLVWAQVWTTVGWPPWWLGLWV
jgi:hypothetical protein